MPIIVICPICGKQFQKKPSAKKVYCSRRCAAISMRKAEPRKCVVCGKEFYKPNYELRRGVVIGVNTGQFCSKKCYGKANSGEDSHSFKSGRTMLANGYAWVLRTDHPHNNHGYVLEHRVVMEEFLGRFLDPQEVVHHINGIKDDNRINNLMLFPDNKSHMLWHNAQEGRKSVAS